jgi:hypothetical protein
MIMFMLIGGMIMLMLGFLGEYDWRLYDNTKNFPTFIVAEQPVQEGTSQQAPTPPLRLAESTPEEP